MKTNNSEKEHNRKKIIACIIIIIAIILLLITSCNSDLFGKIGSLLIETSEHIINPDDNDKDIILNKDLKFDTDYSEISVDDNAYKISYSFDNIDPELFTCTTTDANIATCVVQDGYVEINPKAEGEVSVYVETITNGKIYRGSTKIKISKSSKYIDLSSKSGNINLAKDNHINVFYNLVGINGEVSVLVSDEDIVKATAKDGVLSIEALKEGKVKITLTVSYNDNTYSAVYTLTVINKTSTTTPDKTTTNKTTKTTSDKDKTTSGKKTSKTTKSTTSKDKTTKPTSSSENITKTTKTTKTTKSTTSKVTSSTTKKTSTSSTTKPSETTKVTTSSSVTTSKTTKPTSSTSTTKTTKTTSSTTSSTTKTTKTTTKTTSTSTTKTTSSSTTKTTSSTSTTKPIELDSNSKLSSLEVIGGNLSPDFDPNVLDYTISVLDNKDMISILAGLASNKAKVIYSFNNNIVTDLNDLQLPAGENEVKITVTSEAGTISIYIIKITREVSKDNYLNSLSFSNYPLSPEFDKTTNDYMLQVDYNAESISGEFTKSDNKATTKITINNNEIDDLSDISLNEGDNTLIIQVISENNEVNEYKVVIHRPVRTIEFTNNSYEFKIEEKPYNISYQVFEDNVEITDYDPNDITLSFVNYYGDYTIEKGYIVLDPTIESIDKAITITIKYNNRTSNCKIKITTYEYYLNTFANEYDVSIENGIGYRNIIINTNMLDGELLVENITNGIRILVDDYKNSYIDVTTDNQDVTISFDVDNVSGNSSYAIKVTCQASGTANINIKGSIFGEVVNEVNILLNIIAKYNILIDANGGFFNEFTTVYRFKLEEDETINLSEYIPYKVDTTGNCMYYELMHYNTLSDDTGTKYEKDAILTNFTKDITIYAIYTSESKYIELPENDKLYLTEVDLFHNEEYYEKYNIDKVIYPGAEGSHIMTIENNTGGTIKINQFNLEEDTICIEDKKCLNMGYVIKYSAPEDSNNTYYYGGENNYEILNKDAATTHTTGTLTGYHTENNITLTPEIEILNGESIEVSLLWQWVSEDDELDTKIGNYAANIANLYALTVSIGFEKNNTYCVIGE